MRQSGEPEGFECQRCGARVSAESLDRLGWVVIHAGRDGHALAICPACQTAPEARIAHELREAESAD